MKIALLSVFLLRLAACSKPVQRFVPLGDYALDTKTGRACRPDPLPLLPNLKVTPCYDLYTGKIK